MLQPWRTGKVIAIEDASPSTKRFWLQVPEVEVFDFAPGQFVTLDLPIHEQKNKRWRSYSIASAPAGNNIIELVIVLLEGGAGTNYLFNQVNVGDELKLRGPQGTFVLPPQLDTDIYLICTGTGIAPFRSMVQHIHNLQIPHQQIHLIFGCRFLCDGLYNAELRALEQQEPGFYYHTAYSREENPGEKGHSGYVHKIYEQLVQRNGKKSRFYLCGWKNMVDEAKQRILALGFESKDIHLELYG
jgi:CDP-4-dehydro-6-deoxyglucose reductase